MRGLPFLLETLPLMMTGDPGANVCSSFFFRPQLPNMEVTFLPLTLTWLPSSSLGAVDLHRTDLSFLGRPMQTLQLPSNAELDSARFPAHELCRDALEWLCRGKDSCIAVAEHTRSVHGWCWKAVLTLLRHRHLCNTVTLLRSSAPVSCGVCPAPEGDAACWALCRTL